MSYDPTNSVHGRAQVPGQGDGAGRAAGRASVGRASVNPPDSGSGGSEHAGRAPASAGAAGRASVGRASVGQAVVPYVPGEPVGDVLDSSDQSPRGAGRLGGRGGAQDKASVKRKRARRRNLLIAGTAVFLMLAGVGLVGMTYFFDDIELPQNMDSFSQSTTIYYADGTTPMARIGDENREVVTIDKISPAAQQAVVAAEDLTFYKNDGVDYKGVLRAAVNNFTGGERQGASTITQQYARAVAEDKEISYARKLREAVLAVKIKQRYTNEKILEMYLNTVYFGRSAYGIQAASKAFFGKEAKDLTAAEGMVLAGLIKQPEGVNGSPYDPKMNPETAKDRFNYIKGNMVKLKYLSEADAASMQYPTNVVEYNPKNTQLLAQWGLKEPTGLVVHHVLEEISKLKNADGTPKFTNIKNSGLKIVTTIDQKLQASAVAASDLNGAAFKSKKLKGPADLQAALVSVEPGTGRVRAYYGGSDGSGTDYAANYDDPVFETSTTGGMHPAGSTMKVYTLAAALVHGYTLDSLWNGSGSVDFSAEGGRAAGTNGVHNAGDANPKCGKSCTLWEATEYSLNTPFYGVTLRIGQQKVVDLAHAAGIRTMEATVKDKATGKDKAEIIDLGDSSKINLKDKASVANYFGYEVGFGQYPISVLDHANGVATLAARGWYAPVHFIDKVYRNGEKTVAHDGNVKATRVPGLSEAMVDSISWTLQKVVSDAGLNLQENRQSAGKSGTWQKGNTADNAHVWFVGYTGRDTANRDASKRTNGLATAVWLGSKKDEVALKWTNNTQVYGATGAGPIWKEFMQNAMKGQPKVTFPDRKDTGTIDMGNGDPKESKQPDDPNQPGNPQNSQPGQSSSTPARRNG